MLSFMQVLISCERAVNVYNTSRNIWHNIKHTERRHVIVRVSNSLEPQSFMIQKTRWLKLREDNCKLWWCCGWLCVAPRLLWCVVNRVYVCSYVSVAHNQWLLSQPDSTICCSESECNKQLWNSYSKRMTDINVHIRYIWVCMLIWLQAQSQTNDVAIIVQERRCKWIWVTKDCHGKYITSYICACLQSPTLKFIHWVEFSLSTNASACVNEHLKPQRVHACSTISHHKATTHCLIVSDVATETYVCRLVVCVCVSVWLKLFKHTWNGCTSILKERDCSNMLPCTERERERKKIF